MSIDLGYIEPPVPQPRGTSRRRRLWLLGGGAVVAVAAAVSVASIASAQTTAQTPTASPSASNAPGGPGAPGVPGGPGRGPGRWVRGGPPPFGGFGFGAGPVLHGQYVTAKPGGGYQTVDTQQGQVTAVSSTAITVRSDDGFAQTYTVTANTLVDAQRDGIGSVKTGDKVSVQATVSGSTATATDIRDRTEMQAAHPRPSATR